jgi:hypothetical protein
MRAQFPRGKKNGKFFFVFERALGISLFVKVIKFPDLRGTIVAFPHDDIRLFHVVSSV